MQRYLTAIFEDRERAEAAIRDLQATDIPAEEISIALGRHHHRNLIERLGMSDTPLVTDSNVEGQEAHHVTETGMKTGASIGSVVGLIAGIQLILATGGGAGLLVAGAIALAVTGLDLAEIRHHAHRHISAPVVIAETNPGKSV
jgi:hypothetical protein